MTIIDSSDPQVVVDDQLHGQLANRAVLTTAFVRELERSDNPVWDKRPRAALNALSAYLCDELGFEHGRPDDGLDDLDVPTKFQPLLDEIRRGVVVCDCLRMLCTADTGTEYFGDLRKLNAALANWRTADALSFSAPTDWKVADNAWDRALTDEARNLLYMVAHQALDIRKIGITVSDRLDTWRRRGWMLVRTIGFDDEAALRAAEHLAIQQLDRLKARSSPRMKALFSNLDSDGRTEMYDPVFAPQSLDALISDGLKTSLSGIEPLRPLWISEPLKAAAQKAWKHPDRDGKAAAKKAVATRQQNAAASQEVP